MEDDFVENPNYILMRQVYQNLDALVEVLIPGGNVESLKQKIEERLSENKGTEVEQNILDKVVAFQASLDNAF